MYLFIYLFKWIKRFHASWLVHYLCSPVGVSNDLLMAPLVTIAVTSLKPLRRWRHFYVYEKRKQLNVDVQSRRVCPLKILFTFFFFPDEPLNLFLRSHKPLWPSDSRWSHISVGLNLTFQGQFNQLEKLGVVSGIHAELLLTSGAPFSCADLRFWDESCSSAFGDFVKWVNNPGALSHVHSVTQNTRVFICLQQQRLLTVLHRRDGFSQF